MAEILIVKEELQKHSGLSQQLNRLCSGKQTLEQAVIYEVDQDHFLPTVKLLIECKSSYLVLSAFSASAAH
jgi:hypothetical protein